MGVFRQFPYSNFHDMNMDELIKIVKSMLEDWARYYATWEDWKNGIDASIESFYNWFNNLDVQEEINKKLNAMKQSGELADIMQPLLPNLVTTWLEAHITEPVGVVIDTSLTVEGACADAKATGDRISMLEYLDTFNNVARKYNITTSEPGYCNITDGVIHTTVEGAFNSGKISITKNIKKIVVKNTFKYTLDGICLYNEYDQFIKGYGYADFDINNPYLIIDIPKGITKFCVTWWEDKPDKEVWDFNYQIITEHNNDSVTFSQVENKFNPLYQNSFINWPSYQEPGLERLDNGKFTIEIPSSGNRGVRTPTKLITSNKQLYLIVDYTCSQDTILRLYLWGTNKNTTPNSFYNMRTNFHKGRNIIPIDIDYLDVYSTIDLSMPIGFLVTNLNNDTVGDICTINELSFGYFETDPNEILGVNFLDTIENIRTKFESNFYNRSDFFVAPNGNKIATQIDNNGNIVTIPVIPNKTAIIGNSLLEGFNNNYGITTNFFGMSASDKNHDYYHLVSSYITNLNSSAVFSKYRSSWEETRNENEYRTNTNSILSHIDNDCDLVIIQLGDNINTDEKKVIFPNNAKRLLTEVRNKATHARVIWCGSWYNYELINEVMPEICRSTGCIYIPISDIHTPENENVIGGVYYDDNMTAHYIETAGVASHPDNNGFRDISNRILYVLGISDSENAI